MSHGLTRGRRQASELPPGSRVLASPVFQRVATRAGHCLVRLLRILGGEVPRCVLGEVAGRGIEQVSAISPRSTGELPRRTPPELGASRRTRNPAHLAQQHPRNCESPSAGCPMGGRQIGRTPRRLFGSSALLTLPRPVIVLRPAPSPLRRLQAEVRCRPMVADGARTRPRASAGEPGAISMRCGPWGQHDSMLWLPSA